MSFTWTIAPSAGLIPHLRSYAQAVIAGMQAIGQKFAAIIEAYGKENAPWTDRTGAARQGLRGFTTAAAMSVTIYFVHSVFYGIFLELGTRKMAPRPIIMPALEAHYAAIMGELRAMLA